MTPIGPYRSEFTSRLHFIIKRPDGAVSVIADGEQPTAATMLFVSVRDAATWLLANGFVRQY